METLYSGIRTKFHGKCASDKFFLKIGFMHLLELRPNQNNLIQGRTGHFSLSSLSLAKGSQLPIVTCILTAIIDLLTLTYKPDLDWQGEPPRRIYRSRVISFQSNRTTHTHTHTHRSIALLGPPKWSVKQSYRCCVYSGRWAVTAGCSAAQVSSDVRWSVSK